MNAKTLNLLLIAGIGIGAYLLWKQFSKTVSTVTAPLVNPLADWYAQLTMAGQTIPTGQILLPNGQSVAVVNLVGAIQPVAGTNTAFFSYQGVTYYLCTQSDANGNWAAQTSPC